MEPQEHPIHAQVVYFAHESSPHSACSTCSLTSSRIAEEDGGLSRDAIASGLGSSFVPTAASPLARPLPLPLLPPLGAPFPFKMCMARFCDFLARCQSLKFLLLIVVFLLTAFRAFRRSELFAKLLAYCLVESLIFSLRHVQKQKRKFHRYPEAFDVQKDDLRERAFFTRLPLTFLHGVHFRHRALKNMELLQISTVRVKTK